MDERLLKMHKLKALSLHDNKIRILQNLPGNLETLGISMNALETLGAQSTLQRCRALSVMLAAHNPLACLDGLAHTFPNLVVLDVSFGSLVSLEELEKTLGALPKLMSLNAACNPVALVKQYRMR
jgi:Leucine-rich repeat (LRR) protein